VANSLDFAAALEAHHVPVKLYLYDFGGHGFGMHNQAMPGDWMGPAIEWLRALRR
jgi:acetyl esterase/lipase